MNRVFVNARMVGKWWLWLLIFGQWAVWPALEAAAQENNRVAIAIVVHPDVVDHDITFIELRNIFLGEQQFWSNRKKITLLVRAPVSYERDIVLKRIYEMKESQFRRYWIAKIFRSEVTSGPKIVYSTDMANDLVKVLPGAITFMPASVVDDATRVLRIDGKLPGEEGYPLQ